MKRSEMISIIVREIELIESEHDGCSVDRQVANMAERLLSKMEESEMRPPYFSLFDGEDSFQWEWE